MLKLKGATAHTLLFFFLLFSFGCGRKGDPVAPDQPPAQSELGNGFVSH